GGLPDRPDRDRGLPDEARSRADGGGGRPSRSGTRRDRAGLCRAPARDTGGAGTRRGNPQLCRPAPRLVSGTARHRLCRRIATDRHRQDHPPRVARPPMTIRCLLSTLALVAAASVALAALSECSWATSYKLAISQVADNTAGGVTMTCAENAVCR